MTALAALAVVPFLGAQAQPDLQFIEVRNVDASRKPGVTLFTARKWSGVNWAPRSLHALPTHQAEALGITEQ